MDKVKIIIIAAVTMFLLLNDKYFFMIAYDMVFDPTYEEMVTKIPSLWKMTVLGVASYIFIYPLLVILLSKIMRLPDQKIKYVFALLATITIVSFLYLLIFDREHLQIKLHIVCDIIMVLVAVAAFRKESNA